MSPIVRPKVGSRVWAVVNPLIPHVAATVLSVARDGTAVVQPDNIDRLYRTSEYKVIAPKRTVKP